MTLEELEKQGFRFRADHRRYEVQYWGSPKIGRTIANVSYRLPHSKAELLEKARHDALRYYMACRLEGKM